MTRKDRAKDSPLICVSDSPYIHWQLSAHISRGVIVQ